MQKILKFRNPVCIFETASCVGAEEYRGPLGEKFDFHDDSDKFGAKTWEMAEMELGRASLALAFSKAKMSEKDFDVLFAGDLQNQCVASSGGLSSFGIPFVGLYGACSTLGEGLTCAALALNASEDVQRIAVVTTSHNCAAERQFRLPIEYGGQRPQTAQWTATAGGAFLLAREGFAGITEVMVGKITDGVISDANNMGAAMAPAAAQTISSYFALTKEKPSDFDAIVTGDLAREGSEILYDLLSEKSITLSNHYDCGKMLYDYEKQDVHSGGSGCGCSAAVFSAHFLPEIKAKRIKKMLLVPTGALMSPSSVLQGNSILGIAPLVRIEAV